jgi:uncharacterized RDD family membrane protein YckC
MKLYTIEPKPYIKQKIIATLIDYGIYFLLFIIYTYFFDEDPNPGTASVTGAMSLPLFLFWFLYFPVLEGINQATPGHDICKLKVYTFDGRKPSFSMCFKRRIVDFIDIFMYGIPAFICISKTAKHQRLGDLWAGTVVLKAEDIIEKEIVF